MANKGKLKLEEELMPLNMMFEHSHSVFNLLLNDMMANEPNYGSLTMLHSILEVFQRCNEIQMSPCLIDKNALEPWIFLFKLLLDLPIPDEISGKPLAEEDGDESSGM